MKRIMHSAVTVLALACGGTCSAFAQGTAFSQRLTPLEKFIRVFANSIS